MKKLNNKGFTLVELLAVIIILAIVVGLTIPSILSTVDSSKKKSASAITESASQWIADQYSILAIEPASVNSAFTGVCGSTGSSCLTASYKATKTSDAFSAPAKAFLDTVGIKVADIDSFEVKINSNGSACFKMTVSTTGAYYVASATNEYSSPNC